MRVAVSGCSFTYDSWPNFLSECQVTNLAWPGAGNKYVADSIIHATSINTYDLVLVMWPGITRLDFPVTKNIELFKDYPFKRKIGNIDYVMSGGIMGSWQEHPLATELFEGNYKVLSENDLILLSLLEIIKLQSILRSKNINYYFMSYVNYWNQPNDWLSKNCDPGINNSNLLTPIVNQIDFTPWIFLNSNKDSIAELAIELNSFNEDLFHPGDLANKEWAKLVTNRINS